MKVLYTVGIVFSVVQILVLIAFSNIKSPLPPDQQLLRVVIAAAIGVIAGLLAIASKP